MPFSGYPVFRLSPRGQQLSRPLLSQTSAPLQGFVPQRARRISTLGRLVRTRPARRGNDYPRERFLLFSA